MDLTPGPAEDNWSDEAADAATRHLMEAWPTPIGDDLVFAEQVGREAAKVIWPLAYRAGREDAAKARCPNCEHETRMHGDDGCWFCLDVGVVGESLVCKCPATREGIAREALARAGGGSLTGDQIAKAGQHPRTPGEDVTP